MKNKNFFSISIFTLLVLFSTSCKKDEPTPVANTGQAIAIGDGVFVSDEGNFQGGNAKVSFYRFSDGSSIEDLFSPTNTRPLGDVCQSLSIINGNAYIVVNNSGKIEVANPSNLRSVATITGFVSPRYILPLSSTKAYVSDLYSNTVHVLNLSNNTISGSFAFPGQSEAMTLVNGEVFISSLNHDKVYVVNPITDLITDSIAIAMGGNSMQLDNNGKLWVLCYGDYFTSAAGGLYRINTTSHTVEQSWPFTTFESPTHICSNAAGDTLYYLNYGVYRFPSNTASVPTLPFIAQTTQSFYGLGIRPLTGEIFVTDAVDYSQRGHLLRYTPAGVLTDDKLVGVIPGGIWFY